MSKRFPLEVVMEQTRKQVDAAASALAGLRARENGATQTLDMLENCRIEYQSRLAQSGKTGLDPVQWGNYQEFLYKLDQAISQQRDVLSRCRTDTQAGAREWQEAQLRLKSFDVLRERHERSEAQRSARIEQREQDEHSIVNHRRRDDQS
jgi:flagellar FliJ protein